MDTAQTTGTKGRNQAEDCAHAHVKTEQMVRPHSWHIELGHSRAFAHLNVRARAGRACIELELMRGGENYRLAADPLPYFRWMAGIARVVTSR